MNRIILSFLLLSIFSTSCQPQSDTPASLDPPAASPGDKPFSTPKPFSSTPTANPMPIPSDPQKILSDMTLEQKIGQIMIIGFDGVAVDDGLRQMIRDYHIGGVILFARNVQSPQQVAELTNELQKIAIDSGSPGLFIAIDQEGGRVARLTENTGFTEIPGAMAIGATNDPANAKLAAQILAREMKAVGLNADFAPDLDVNNNPANPVIGVRSFGSDPQKVAEFGVAFIDGLQSEGVLAFGKHFPGHGDTGVDSHIDLPIVPHDRARLETVEFVPFKAAIQANVAGIMSAHVTFPAIDPTPGMPATLSKLALTDLLRNEMGYNGLIITDSLEMGALASNGNPAPLAAVKAFEAGADLLLFNRDYSLHKQAFDGLLAKVKSGEISEQRLAESVRRILAVKAQYNIINPALIPDPAQAGKVVGAAENHALALDLARKSITLLKDDAKLLPLRSGEPVLVIETPAAKGLGQLLNATTFEIANDPDTRAIDSAFSLASDGRKVIITATDAGFYAGQVRLVTELLKENRNIIIVSVRTPYDISVLPEVPTVLASYGGDPPTLQAIAEVLTGKTNPLGALPVELPEN